MITTTDTEVIVHVDKSMASNRHEAKRAAGILVARKGRSATADLFGQVRIFVTVNGYEVRFEKLYPERKRKW